MLHSCLNNLCLVDKSDLDLMGGLPHSKVFDLLYSVQVMLQKH